MQRKMTKVVVAFLSVAALSGVISFAVTNALASGDKAPTVDQNDSGSPAAVRVSTLEEARVAAGYEVRSPSFLPDGFTRRMILVSFHSGPEGQKHVVQTYASDAAPGLILIKQDPQATGLTTSGTLQPETIRGFDGKKAIVAPIAGRSADMVVYFWREGGFGYTVLAFLTGPIDEDIVKRVMESIQ